MFARIFLVCLLLINLTDATSNDEYPVLETRLGKVRGSVLKSQNGKGFFAFRGIPYAQPPVKDLRFEPPVPVSKWEGELDATEDGYTCIQYDVIRRKLMGDEDCLYLNVYTSQLTPTTLKPVMVWIHGGGFHFGEGSSSMYGPDKLMDKDIVLVAINYRLAALGFLSTGDSVSPGNYGLLDQVQALKWVQENIDTFGGDPNSVTIFGESAGGASVIYHVISPLSKGLFHGAIAQSGTATASWAFSDDPFEQSKKLASFLKCPTDNSKELVHCLKKRSALDIIVESSWSKYLDARNENATHLIPPRFLPTVDKISRDQPFLPEIPKDLIENNQLNHVPIIIGTTKDEGYFFFLYVAENCGFQRLLQSPVNRIPNYLQMLESKPKFAEAKQLIANYFADIGENSSVEEKILTISNYFGDSSLTVDVDFTVENLVANGVPTYAYKLTRRGSTSFTSQFPVDADTNYEERLNIVSHLDDLLYLFKSNLFPDHNFDKNDKTIEDYFLTLWTNFAKNKFPSFEGSNSTDLEWNQTLPGKRMQLLDINLNPRMTTGYFSAKPEVFKKEKHGK